MQGSESVAVMTKEKYRPVQTFIYTGFALGAFATNSVLCRMALRETAIDAASFLTIRLVSGATILLLISRVFGEKHLAESRGYWASAIMLFLYAAAFSFAYLSLSAGTGALILFGTVQATMIFSALRSGERPYALEWIGLFLALVGLVYLVFPGLMTPSAMGSVFMVVAGISWGMYSLRGRGTIDPLADTTNSFVRSLPLVVGVSLISFQNSHLSAKGILLAVLSGALASGVGYATWYAALRGLTTTQAATVQLLVPVLAALGGVIFLSENISIRLLLAAIMILGGVGLAVTGRRQSDRHPTSRADDRANQSADQV